MGSGIWKLQAVEYSRLRDHKDFWDKGVHSFPDSHRTLRIPLFW